VKPHNDTIFRDQNTSSLNRKFLTPTQ